VRLQAVEARNAIVGGAALALIATAAVGLFWIACYEVRVCPGDRQMYIWSALTSILALYALSLIHLVRSKLKGRR